MIAGDLSRVGLGSTKFLLELTLNGIDEAYNLNVKSVLHYLRSPYRGRAIAIALRTLGWSFYPILALDFCFSNTKPRYIIQSSIIFPPKLFAYVKHGEMDLFDLELFDFFRNNGFYCILCSDQDSDSGVPDLWIRKNRLGRDSTFLRDLTRHFKNLSSDGLELAFFNDSMVWDSEELPRLLIKLRSYNLNTIVFPTESNNPRNHIQPYFLYVRLNNIGLQRFSESFYWIRTLHLKRSLVRFVEYVFLEKILSLGWEVQIIVKHMDLFNSDAEAFAGRKINPNQHAWDKLPKLGLVGIKRSLIKSNPVGVNNAPKSLEEALITLRKLKRPLN
jgi:hypothetical protein